MANNKLLDDVWNYLDVDESARSKLDKIELRYASNTDSWLSIYLVRLSGRLIGTIYQTEIAGDWKVSGRDLPEFEFGWEDQSMSLVAAVAKICSMYLTDLLRN